VILEIEMKELVKKYYDGMYYGDADKLNEVFHSEARLQGYMQGQMLLLDYAQWLEILSQSEAPAVTKQPYQFDIMKVDETGDIATIKVTNLLGGMSFIDYLSLLRADGQWKIVNKLFHHEPIN
jgi:hypothetical protein